MYSSFACLYIFVMFWFFCFVFCFVFCICLIFLVLFLIYLECSTPFHGKIRAVHMYVECLI